MTFVHATSDSWIRYHGCLLEEWNDSLGEGPLPSWHFGANPHNRRILLVITVELHCWDQDTMLPARTSAGDGLLAGVGSFDGVRNKDTLSWPARRYHVSLEMAEI